MSKLELSIEYVKGKWDYDYYRALVVRVDGQESYLPLKELKKELADLKDEDE